MCHLHLCRTVSCLACLLLKARWKQCPVPRESLASKKYISGSHPNWKECLAGKCVPNSSSHFSWSLEALKGKFIFYLDILVISNLLVSKQLSFPTNEVLMKAKAPVLKSPRWKVLIQRTPLKSNTTDTRQSSGVPTSCRYGALHLELLEVLKGAALCIGLSSPPGKFPSILCPNRQWHTWRYYCYY